MPSTASSRLEGLTTSVAVKAPCRAGTTANVTLSGLQTVDGVALAEGDRVLVMVQTDATANGIYVASSGAWRRAKDFNGSLDAVGGTLVGVSSGEANQSSYWRVVGSGPVDIGTDEIEFGSALDRGFLLNAGWLTPWMFGAVGPYPTDRVFGGDSSTWDVVDNTEAIQALLDYVSVQTRKVVCDLRGNWGITDHDSDGHGLIIDQPRDNAQIFIGGTFIALGAMENIIYAKNFRNSEMHGTLGLLGATAGGNLEELSFYSQRVAKHGLRIENCNRSYWQEVKVANTKSHGVTDYPDGPGNNIHMTMERVFGTGNGSWPFDANSYATERTFSTRVDQGDDGNPNQSTVLGGISNTSDFEVGSFAWIPTLPDTAFYILAKTASTITVYPWPDHAVTTGALRPMHGAALSLVNNDNTGVLVNQLDAFYAGEAAVKLAGLYGAQVLELQAQFCSSAVAIGKNEVGGGGPNICRGARIGRLHSELNEFDIIQVSGNSWWDIGAVACISQEGDTGLLQRVITLKPRYASGTLGGIEAYSVGLAGHIRIGGTSYSPKGFCTNGRVESSATYSNGADGRPYYLHLPDGFAHTVNLLCDEFINARYMGCHALELIVTGSGSSGQPTASITVQPTTAQTTAGYTVNGGASVTIANLPQFAHIICSRDPGSLNWTIAWSGRGRLRGSATYDPPSLAAGAKTTIQTMAITGLVLGDHCDSASFTNNLAGARIYAWCSATDVASFYFVNENGTDPLDLASGTVELLFQRKS